MNIIASQIETIVWVNIVFLAFIAGIVTGLLISKLRNRNHIGLILIGVIALGGIAKAQVAPDQQRFTTLTVDADFGARGNHRMWECVAGAQPPMCEYVDPPPGLPECGIWNNSFHSSFSVPCQYQTVHLSYYQANGLIYIDVWDWPVTPNEVTGNCDVGYKASSAFATFYPPCIPTPTPSPTPTPTPTCPPGDSACPTPTPTCPPNYWWCTTPYVPGRPIFSGCCSDGDTFCAACWDPIGQLYYFCCCNQYSCFLDGDGHLRQVK